MSNRTEDIRKIMEALELAETHAPEILDEGPLDGIKAFFHKRAGKAERAEMLAHVQKEWHTWLGRMNRKGTINDVEDFLRDQVKFSENDIDHILGPATVQDTATDTEQPDPTQTAVDDTDSSEVDSSDKPAGPSEPEAEATAADNNEPNEEDGIPLPDSDARLSDYGDVGYEKFEVEPDQFKDADGSWDQDKLLDGFERYAEHADGKDVELDAGGTIFRLSPTGKRVEIVKQPQSANESILNELNGPKVPKSELSKIWGKVVDLYIKQGNVRNAGSSNPSTATRTATNSGKSTVSRGNDPYDLDKMWGVLKQHQMTPSMVTRIKNKVRGASSVADLTDQDMSVLGMIGYAFLKSSS